LFGLIDNILTKDLPITIPLEIHVFWYFAPEDIRQDFEARIVIDIEKMQVKHSEPILFSSSTPYTHLRLRGITIDHTGECHAYIEWRRIDSSDWTREDVFWPFIVSLQPK
jgi:hypothetical protein